MSLTQYWAQDTGRPINKWAHYLPLYEKFFAPFKGRSVFFLEIGTGQGGSSQMWKDYLGASAQVVTCDIREDCRQFETDQIKVRIGDQSDPAFLQSIFEEFGPPDIVLDDGSHIMAHVQATFRYLFPRCARDAVYFVEDMHTAYWPAYGGGLRHTGSFIEDMKALIDEINATNPHHAALGAGEMPASSLAALVRGVSFYPSVVVIEKGPFVDMEERSIPFVEGATIW